MGRVEYLALCLSFAFFACSGGEGEDAEGQDVTGQGGNPSLETGGSGGDSGVGGELNAAGGSAAMGGSVTMAGIGGAPAGGESSAGGTATGGGGGGGPEGSVGGAEAIGGAAGAGGNDAGAGGQSGDGCAFSGHIQYAFNGEANWPADVVQLLTEAMDGAVYYYNCYADLTKSLTINFDPGVETAQGNVDGWISFGNSRSYMVVATAMHEVAHTLGVGYYPWVELMDDGLWVGPAVNAFMKKLPPEQRDPDEYSQRDYIRGDGQHFWPYGLNQASEHQSEWSLINHVRIVAAMQLDKQAF